MIDTVELAKAESSRCFLHDEMHHTSFNSNLKKFFDVDGTQLQWIEQTLQKYSLDESIKWIIVAGHYSI